MAAFKYCVLILFTFVVYEQRFVEAACPSDVTAAAPELKSCLTSAGLSINITGLFSGMSDMEHFQLFCDDRTLDQAQKCLKAMLDECKVENSRSSSFFTQLISVDNIRAGIDYLCDNVKVLSENAQCLAKLDDSRANTCEETAEQRFLTELEAKRHQLQKDDILESACGFLDGIFRCYMGVYSAECDEKVTGILMHFYRTIKPSVCSKYSSATSMVTSSWLMLLGLSVILFLYFKP